MVVSGELSMFEGDCRRYGFLRYHHQHMGVTRNR